jgi:hypothetical protein
VDEGKGNINSAQTYIELCHCKKEEANFFADGRRSEEKKKKFRQNCFHSFSAGGAVDQVELLG